MPTGLVSHRRADTRRNLVDVVPTLLKKHTSEQAFRTWTGHLARYMITKRGPAAALRSATTSHEELFASAYEAMLSAVATLLEANVRAGSIRTDLDPSTVLRALGGPAAPQPERRLAKPYGRPHRPALDRNARQPGPLGLAGPKPPTAENLLSGARRRWAPGP
ncbi:MAG: hypothetical protein ACJ72N_08170 [Labedaea sp.]